MMGACRVSATARTSARAFAQPDPARMVTFFAMLSDSAALLRLAAGGRTEAAGPQIPRSIATEEHPSAKTSPGMTMTATHRLAIAVRIARGRIGGICSGLEITGGKCEVVWR